jgi:hypothetical protein
MINISNSLYLSVQQAIYGNPIIGYQSILEINNVLADSSPDETPDINLVNEHTHQFWESDSTDEQNFYFFNDDLADVDYIGIARHNFGTGNISYQLQGNIDRPWNLADAVFADEYNNGLGRNAVYIKPDGLRIFVAESIDNTIIQYNLSTAWDVSTASASAGFFDFSLQTGSPASLQGVWFKPDGSKMYGVSQTDGIIYQYTLPTPWDVTTAVYDSVSFSTGLNSNRNMFIRPDGLKMYLSTDSAGATDRVRQYTLSVAWNISTATYDSIFLSTASQEAGPFGCFFHPSGKFFYTIGTGGDSVYQYDLTAPWDLNTASYGSVSFSVAAQESAPRSVFFHPDGTSFFIVGAGSGDIHQYHIADDWVDITQDAIPENDNAIIRYFDNTNYAQYRLKLIPDETAPQVAHIKLGAALVLPQSIYVGHSPVTLNRRTDIVTNTSENGQFLGRIEKRRYLQTSVSMTHIEPDFYRDSVDPFVEHAETGTFFFAWRPVGYPKEIGYGWTGGDVAPENQMPNGMMQFSFNMKAVA